MVPTVVPTMLEKCSARVSRMASAPLSCRVVGELGEAEVEHLHLPRRVMKMFAGLMSRWRMPSPCAASSASAICTRNVEQRPEIERPAVQALVERLALEQLHRQIALPGLLVEAVDRADVG